MTCVVGVLRTTLRLWLAHVCVTIGCVHSDNWLCAEVALCCEGINVLCRRQHVKVCLKVGFEGLQLHRTSLRGIMIVISLAKQHIVVGDKANRSKENCERSDAPASKQHNKLPAQWCAPDHTHTQDAPNNLHNTDHPTRERWESSWQLCHRWMSVNKKALRQARWAQSDLGNAG